jgi:adenylate cyclase
METEGYKRKLTAILSADVEGYSRLMGEDEDATIRTLTAYRELMATLIQKHRGRVVDSPGDNLLAEFGSVVDAVRCAVEIQEELRVRNAELPENRRMHFRIGINLGDVVQEEERIYGDGINIAARVEGLAEGGGICISGTVYDSIKNKLSLTYESLGEHTVKNITEPVRVYRMRVGPEASVSPPPHPWHKKTALAALIVLMVAAGAFAIWNFYFRPPPIEPASEEKMAFPLPDKPSIAVLPFTNMSEDPKQEYFSDGLTEEIITALSKTPQMFVIARNSTFSYKGKPVKVQQVAEELGVRYVLEGSVRESDNRLRITAQLIDALTGRHLWAERYDRDLKDIFALQDEITLNILSALAVKLTKGEQATIRRKDTDNLEAYLKVLQAGWYSHRMTKEGHFRARQLAEEAMALDPEYASPYIILALHHIRDVFFGWSKSRKKSLEQALELAQKAIALDDSFPRCYVLLSTIYMFKKQYERAIAEAERAIALDPNGADAYSMLGTVLHMVGRQQEAIMPLEKAIRINPMAPSIYFRRLGTAYRDIGRYEEAIVQLKKAISLSPDSLYPHIGLATTYSLAGRDEEARSEVSEVLRIQPKFSLQSFAKRVAFKNKADIDRIVGALRKAGLPETPPLPLPDKPSIAVLPFTNMSDDPKQEYFSDGISEEIITALSKTSKLFVIARTSSFKYKGKDVDVRTVGRELGVRYVLEGSVRKSGDTVRITAQLIDATTGNHVWAQRYDRDLKDIFALQDELTMKILTALQVKLTEGEQAGIYARGTDNLEAYLKSMKANWLFSQSTKDGVLKARQMAEEAISLDSNYAFAYRVLGSAHGLTIVLGMSKNPRESLKCAIELFRKAIELDDSLAVAHAALGFWSIYARQYDTALAEGRRAFELEPNSADVINGYAAILTFLGEPEEAIPLYKEALRLNPKPPSLYLRFLGIAFRDSGQYEKAIVQAKKAVEQEPNDLVANVVLTSALSLAGHTEEARAAAKEILRLNPKFSVARWQKRSPHKDRAVVKRYCDALRKAGLPE